MEHEVFVPVPEEPLREALADPERVARAVPGLQRDADPGPDALPVTGRLKVRVGGHTITYRGGLRVAARGDGGYAVTGEAHEARGSGAVTFSLVLRLAAAAEGGTQVAFSGTASADGRVAEAVKSSPQAVESAVRRLLARFAEGLAAPGPAAAPEPAPAPAPSRVFDAEVPPPALDPLSDVDSVDSLDDAASGPEAAHARRTMIGRSAEEVDHAPPRGRYAPVPAPETLGGGAALRWAAPAAAVLVASAIVVTRALRKRR
ncbi:SRPBCC domain-containing protein [Streptomyces sp. AN091965]|uniref:SRPBCC domain-containing protein n=1 Tax=Streptomyces sp. AN091965 TaxID=2927803 RepID=UPI001F61973A|nr:SRPBCC domain-containing protein [Streptomyces sp. AN091965]MCI3932008.1 carbon monoxide dehydrogenase subunit G [Streptomyces sp. AN091965]